MMLGWTRYIIDKKLYNEEFCSKWTNLPFLVDPSDPAGALLRASKVFADVTAENEGYVYYDEKTGEVTKAFALGPDNEASYNPRCRRLRCHLGPTAPPSRRRLPS